MNSINEDVFSDRCNVPLFLLNEAAKLIVLVLISYALLCLVPVLDQTVIEAKQSIPSDFITTQLSAFDAQNRL